MGQFNNEGIRRLLAWIILDENARKSYESIALYFTIEAKKFEVQTSWRFHFNLPLLENIALKTVGYFDSENKEYTVYKGSSLRPWNASNLVAKKYSGIKVLIIKLFPSLYSTFFL